MSVINLPDNQFASIDWTLVEPVQTNRSEFTSARQVLRLPGAAYWRARAEHVPIVGEANAMPWRAFLAQLQGATNRFDLPAGERAQTAFAFPVFGGSAGTNAAGVSIVGRTITKTTGTLAWDAAAWTSGAAGFTGGSQVSFRAARLTDDLMVGLNSDPGTDNSFLSIDGAIYLRSANGGTFDIYENGVSVTGGAGLGSYLLSDVFSVVYDNASLAYYRNGHLLRRVARGAGQTMHMDSSFATPGAQAVDVSYSGLASSISVAAGATQAQFPGFTPATVAFRAGWMMTALLRRGGAQLVMITEDAVAQADGTVLVRFAPMLRDAPIAFVTDRPFARLALDDAAGWRVGPGQRYDLTLTATEAF